MAVRFTQFVSACRSPAFSVQATCALLFLTLMAVPHAASAGSIPEAHAAVLLAKCLPYNDEWEGRSTLEILVLTVGEEGELATAEEFATLLRNVGSKLHDLDPEKPTLHVVTSTLRQFELSTLSSEPPQLAYLAEGQGRSSRPLQNKLSLLAEDARRLGILVFTDSPAAYRDAASIYFALGTNNRPEIFGDLERVREQGGRLQGTFQRLLKRKVQP